MNTKRNFLERGQSLVIVTLGMMAFLAFMALAIDGGYTWTQRRNAQTAADAGALAGTRELCISGSSSAATTAANTYAITKNGATTTTVNVLPLSASVEVTANIRFRTFFAHLLGRPEIEAQAIARATCLLPGSAEGVLPIGWSCRPPIPGKSSSEDCQQETITEDEYRARRPWNTYPADGKLYLVMDNYDFEDDLNCETGVIECDLDGDGEIDVLGGGDRSWLDLDGGGGGANELRDWIRNGFSPELTTHTWVPGQRGTANSIFQAAATRIGDIVVLPIFDMFCTGDMSGSDCATRVHTGDPNDTIVPMTGASTNVHIISFSGFGITCVKAPGVAGSCPGWQRFQTLNSSNPQINPSFKSIEGYFIHGFVPGVGGGEPGIPDGGVYVLLLTK